MSDYVLIGLQYVIVVFPDHTHPLFSGLLLRLILEVFAYTMQWFCDTYVMPRTRQVF